FKEKDILVIEKENNIKMLNPIKNPDLNKYLNLSISTSIDLNSLIFIFSKNNHKSENFNEIKSDNNIQESKYN
ncbi:28240_t:CDS:1, partial [Gigaspora margarita]